MWWHLANIGSVNGLLPGSMKSLPEPIFIYHQQCLRHLSKKKYWETDGLADRWPWQWQYPCISPLDTAKWHKHQILIKLQVISRMGLCCGHKIIAYDLHSYHNENGWRAKGSQITSIVIQGLHYFLYLSNTRYTKSSYVDEWVAKV